MTVSSMLLLTGAPTVPSWPELVELVWRLSSDMEPDEDATLFQDGVVLRELS